MGSTAHLWFRSRGYLKYRKMDRERAENKGFKNGYTDSRLDTKGVVAVLPLLDSPRIWI